jgi:uncharacterized protein involved in exopolysaccharide biosynthesis
MSIRIAQKVLFTAVAVLLGTATCFAQENGRAKPTSSSGTQTDQQVIRSSPAYAEILLRKTELQASLESMLSEYTEEYPKVQESRYSLQELQRESDRIMAVKSTELGKLSLALGKLIVRKVELETELWTLLKTYKDDHPEVKRARRKVETFEAAIKEILG